MTCQKFNSCGAPLCSFDKNIKERVYYKDEPICSRWKNLEFRKSLTEEQKRSYLSKITSREKVR